jgi:hypothetical protein
MTIVLQNVIKPGFFVISGRNSGEIESEFYYDYAKQTQFLNGPNERKYLLHKGI